MRSDTLTTTSAAVRCEELVKTYRTASGEVRALRGVTAEFPAGTLVAVVGPSGSGKSSLLRLVAGLDRPSDGALVVERTAVHEASARELRRFRRTTVGYLFQRPSDNFLPHLSVREHLKVATRLTHRPPRIGQDELLSTLEIDGRVDHLASELSGGEQQRAAIAEVLMGGAHIVVADEPTAELDSGSARHVMETIDALVEAGVTFVIATHDRDVMRRAGAVLELDHGVRTRGRSVGAVAAEPAKATKAEPDAVRWRAATRMPALEPDVPSVLEVRDVSKSYPRGEEVVRALDGVSASLYEGELVGLVGRSGSGKTTLLNVIAGWERPDAGDVERPGGAVPVWSELAVVPQKLGLFDELTVRENLEYPARLVGRVEELRDRVRELMEALGIDHLHARYPRETSLGEQQRAAVARALVLSPTLVLADEPTGHQDAVSERRVLDAFAQAASSGAACLIATHNEALSARLDRVVHMADGRLAESASDS